MLELLDADLHQYLRRILDYKPANEMNSLKEINTRLLRLYPAAAVKTHYGKTGSISTVLKDVIESNDSTSIDSFAKQNFGYLKQHVYVFELARSFNALSFNSTAGTFPLGRTSQHLANGEIVISCFPQVIYSGTYSTVTGGYDKFQMHFKQPIKIVFRNRILIVFAGILETTLKNNVGGTDKPFNVKKTVDDDFIGELRSYLESEYRSKVLDLTKGLKVLCENDTLDFAAAVYHKDASLSSEIMKEDKTLKKEMPDVFEDMMRRPLEKSQFRYQLGDGLLPHHFAADPVAGRINVPFFPSNVDQVKNVIDKIIANC